MKPAHFLTSIFVTFVTATMIAGFVPPDDAGSGAHLPIPVGPRKRASTTQESQPDPLGIPTILAGMERQIVHYQAPEVKTYDGKKMEELLGSENLMAFGHSGSFAYSLDWAREDPAGMFEWLNQLPLGRFNRPMHFFSSERQSLTSRLFSPWAEKDMSAALAAIPRMTHAECRAQALVSTLEVLCQKEPARARELLLQNMDSLGALKSVDLGSDHGKERTNLILALPPGKIRSLLLAKNIGSLVNSCSAGPELATELWNKSSLDERRELVAAGLYFLEPGKIQLNGLEDLTKQHAETTNDPEQARHFLCQFGQSWAARDPNGALSWTLSRIKGRERTSQYMGLMKHAAAKNFDGAMSAWQSLPEGSLRYKTAEILARAVPEDRAEEKAMLEQSGAAPQGADAW